MDRVLLPEKVMEEYMYSTYNSVLLFILTLYAPTVVPLMDRVLLLERVMEYEEESMAVVPPPVKLGGMVKEVPTISIVDESVIVRSAVARTKLEGLALTKVYNPPVMLTRLIPPLFILPAVTEVGSVPPCAATPPSIAANVAATR